MMNLPTVFGVATDSRPCEALPGRIAAASTASQDSRSFGAARVRRPARPQAPDAGAQRFIGEEGGRHAIQQARSG